MMTQPTLSIPDPACFGDQEMESAVMTPAEGLSDEERVWALIKDDPYHPWNDKNFPMQGV